MKGKRLRLTPGQLDRLAEQLRAIPHHPEGEHCTDAQLVSYCLDMLTDREIESADAHLATCEDCAAKLADLLQFTESSVSPATERQLARLRQRLLEQSPVEDAAAAQAPQPVPSGVSGAVGLSSELLAALTTAVSETGRANWVQRLRHWASLLQGLKSEVLEPSLGAAVELEYRMVEKLQKLWAILPVALPTSGQQVPGTDGRTSTRKAFPSRARGQGPDRPKGRQSHVVDLPGHCRLSLTPGRAPTDLNLELQCPSAEMQSRLLVLIPVPHVSGGSPRVLELKRVKRGEVLTARVRNWAHQDYLVALEPSPEFFTS